jgi:general secretion pathway protein C
VALAEEAPCTPVPVNASIEVSLKKGAKLKDLAAWYRQITCREIEAPLSAADTPLALTVEGKIPAGRILEVVRAAAASAGYDARDEFRKLTLQKAAEPCDPAKTNALLARVAKAPSCAIDLDAMGCADGRLTLEETAGKVKVAQLDSGSLLHAIGLREGDELADDKATLTASMNGPRFELEVLRGGAKKTLRCEISGERNVRLHPASLLREALRPPADSSSCSVDPEAITSKGDVIEVNSSKSSGLDFNCLTRACRIVPAIRDGKANGFKLYAIRPNTLLALLGFQNGDTVKTINGRELDSPDKALEVYSALRNEKKFTVALERRGQPMSLVIVIK